jgi:hypothetical protein
VTTGDLSAETFVVPAADVVACDLEDGKALLNLATSKYFKLNGSAAFLWEALGSGSTIASICSDLLEHFDVDQEQCTADVFAIIQAFREAGLVETEAMASSPGDRPRS